MMAEDHSALTTKDQMLERIRVLSAEMDANDEENRAMQAEIETLYAKIDSMQEIAAESADDDFVPPTFFPKGWLA